MRLDDTVARSTLGVVRSQLDELLAREARLLAEREEALDYRVEMPVELTARRNEKAVNSAMAGRAQAVQIAAHRPFEPGGLSSASVIGQSQEEIVRLSAMQKAKEPRDRPYRRRARRRQRALEVEARPAMSRVKQLERDKARLEGERRPSTSPTSRGRAARSARPKAADPPARPGFPDRRAEGSAENHKAKIAELKERLGRSRGPAQEDRHPRAPQAGIVHQLSVHTVVRGVIANGETVMQIVPDSDAIWWSRPGWRPRI